MTRATAKDILKAVKDLTEGHETHRQQAQERHEASLEAQVETRTEMTGMRRSFDKSEQATEKLRDELRDQGKLIVEVNGLTKQAREIADAANKKATTATSRLDKMDGVEVGKRIGVDKNGDDKPGWIWWLARFFLRGP